MAARQKGQRTPATLLEACHWIALNDNAGGGDSVEDIAGYITTGMVSDLFGSTMAKVALEVARIRRDNKLEVGIARRD